MKKISDLILTSETDIESSFRPVFLPISSASDLTALQNTCAKAGISIIYRIEEQVKELIKSKNPGIKPDAAFYDQAILEYAKGNIFLCGTHVYYPWLKKVIHLLDQKEFVEVRTNRNRLKITTNEQEILRSKKIGVIGLSVGQSISLTLAMERTCGEIRLADFDEVELSNLNRIRTGVQNLGLKKVIVAAREIAEIDPYIDVKIFPEGVTETNTDDFFTTGGTIDLLVEVCDGLDVKIKSRYKARELGIPVVMDTNDRGMLDIERFDLEPQRPILHGLAGSLNPDNIKDLTNEQKIPYILDMVDAYSISTRLKASMMEVEQSVNTWPQLASSVVLGGAITTDICRRILLGQYEHSGRYYVDLDDIIAPGKEISFKTSAVKESQNQWDELVFRALCGSQSGTTLPFTYTASEDSSLELTINEGPFQYLNIIETGMIIQKMEQLLAGSGEIPELEWDKNTDRLKLLKKKGSPQPGSATLQSMAAITKPVSESTADLNNLAELERLIHFSPSAHQRKYANIDFGRSPGKVPFEQTGLPLFARPLYLMASDPEAIKYLAEWNKGKALAKLAAFRLGQASHLHFISIPAERDQLFKAGRLLQQIADTDSVLTEINTTLVVAQNCTDLPLLYTDELKTRIGELFLQDDITKVNVQLICTAKTSA